MALTEKTAFARVPSQVLIRGRMGSNMTPVLNATSTEPLEALLSAIRFLNDRGWTPATSSNFSCRVPHEDRGFLITVSGKDKGNLTHQDFMAVDWSGQALGSKLKPSAETLLHRTIYEIFPDAQTVLHCHSVNATVFSKFYERQGGVWLTDFEILKAFEGICSHEERVWLPIFSNSQDMNTLAKQVAGSLQQHPRCFGFLLAGHGLYAWGDSPAQARRHVEAFEFLFDCLLKLHTLNFVSPS